MKLDGNLNHFNEVSKPYTHIFFSCKKTFKKTLSEYINQVLPVF